MKNLQKHISRKGSIIIILVLCLMAVAAVSFTTGRGKSAPNPVKKDSIASVNAFMNVYKVLMSPRCMNCHPSGDVPLQGDDSHIHTMLPKRGVDGHGVYAMKCSNCHQAENTAGLHTPPGNPKWGLPPARMKMVFQGRTPRQLALQLLDKTKNGGRTKKDLYDHMAKDDLVGWGWHPGQGRTLPPMSRPAFAAQVKLWLDNGAYAPKQ